MMENSSIKNEQLKLHRLGRGIKIYTSEVHRFGTDAVLLADFASPCAADSACDLGTGCGIIPLLWRRNGGPKEITAVDIQPEAVVLLQKSLELNGIGGVTPVCADLRELDGSFSGKFTLVTMNPPYKKLSGGLISPDSARAVARHEVKCTVDDAVRCAARLLKPSGRLCMCHRPERLCDLLCAMRAAGIEPKRLRLVCQRDGSAPSLVLCEGRRGGRPGMTVDAPFIIEDEQGGYSADMARVYADYLTDGEDEK